MGGVFGVASSDNCITDLFFGVDYHSHLGTRRGGLAVYNAETGFERAIHNIENSPFRTKFERDVDEMAGPLGIGCISDTDPQPLIVRSHLGTYAITTVGRINNLEELVGHAFENGSSHFLEMSGGKVNATELTACLINQKDTLADGIRNAQELIDGSMTMLLLTKDGLVAARDRMGRTPLIVGKKEGATCVSFESFAYLNLGYRDEYSLGPGEIVRITADGYETLVPARKPMKICAFLWTYFGYPTSSYEGVNVEQMRYDCGRILAQQDRDTDADYVAGVPDSGTAHAIGYANESGIPFARPFIKYTPTWPRSFMPTNQKERDRVAKMKQIPVHELIEGKKLLFVDDSIVRGTQLRETVEFLYANGAKEVHIRSACPPIMYGCKFLNFSTSRSPMELIARRTVYELEGEEGEKHLDEYSDPNTERGQKLREAICQQLHFTSLEYQSLDELIKAIGLEPCKVCTYCWNGKE